MMIINLVFSLTWYLVTTAIFVVIALMLVRLLINYADPNPFSWPVLTVRRFTDPLITPVRRALVGFGIGPNAAPVVTILLVILVGWFALSLSESILNTAAGILYSAERGLFVAMIGYLLYGALALYSLLLFMRIVLSWGMTSYGNPVMRFLVQATDPLLVPLRQRMPPLGMFDLSALVAFFIIWLFQAAITGTLLRGLPLGFVH